MWQNLNKFMPERFMQLQWLRTRYSQNVSNESDVQTNSMADGRLMAIEQRRATGSRRGYGRGRDRMGVAEKQEGRKGEEIVTYAGEEDLTREGDERIGRGRRIQRVGEA
ncbi:hypothetical protein Scep_012852 [Stephania cephalantha]|uniref:Uncharacterized protein n=1 Tax=Stephania cephalantha TaxID=152367 RepID=A0AAP0JG64_9MAGN